MYTNLRFTSTKLPIFYIHTIKEILSYAKHVKFKVKLDTTKIKYFDKHILISNQFSIHISKG